MGAPVQNYQTVALDSNPRGEFAGETAGPAGRLIPRYVSLNGSVSPGGGDMRNTLRIIDIKA